jgi:redox-sensitive bicupin YhaK (pirin superfamily)
MTLTIRLPESIYRAQGPIQNGTFSGRWHFSFGDYYDAKFVNFGALHVFNDDTLSPGAVWPLHPHREIEVVTYCAEGEFKHADEKGEGGVLKKGWVQHTTVGRGMWHSEINNRTDVPMRFIQMWFLPFAPGLLPSIEQMKVEISHRTNRLLPLVSNAHPGALPISSPAMVFSSFLEAGKSLNLNIEDNWGAYLYLLEGGPAIVNDHALPVYGAAMIRDQDRIDIAAQEDAELLLVEVKL